MHPSLAVVITPEDVAEKLIPKSDQIESLSESDSDPNPFVPLYLNSLHSRNAETDNVLAEAQARNPFFAFIHVPRPIYKN